MEDWSALVLLAVSILTAIAAIISAIAAWRAARAAERSANTATSYALRVDGDFYGPDDSEPALLAVVVTNLGPAVCHSYTVKQEDLKTEEVLSEQPSTASLGPGGKSEQIFFADYMPRKESMTVYWKEEDGTERHAWMRLEPRTFTLGIDVRKWSTDDGATVTIENQGPDACPGFSITVNPSEGPTTDYESQQWLWRDQKTTRLLPGFDYDRDSVRLSWFGPHKEKRYETWSRRTEGH